MRVDPDVQRHPLRSRGWSRYPSICPGCRRRCCGISDGAPPPRERPDLIAAVAGRLPGSLLVFDVVPEKMLELVRRMSGPERDQAVELWSWSFSAHERAAISKIPGVAGIADLVPPRALGMVPVTLRAVRLLPRRVRYALPVFPVLRVRFR